MKYFSIFKDSFREALDSKILYVTFGMSFLLVLFLGSLSFRPLTAREDIEGPLDILNELVFAMRAKGQMSREATHVEVIDFQQTNDAREPWRGDYRFTVVLHVPETAKSLGKKDMEDVRGITAVQLWWVKTLDIPPARWTDDGREGRFTVSGHGSRIADERSWPHEPSLLFGAVEMSWFRMSLSYAVYLIENRLVNTVGGWVIVLLGVIVTASFIPNMLRKGTVDLLLAKPVTRPGLLVFKYIGGLNFLFLNALVAIGGVWLVLGLRTGIWTWSFLVTVLILTFFFAILYAISTLVAVVTRSTVVSILLTLLTWAVLFGVGLFHDSVHPSAQTLPNRSVLTEGAPSAFPPWALTGIDVVYAVLPRTGDLGALSTHLISSELLSEAERQHRLFEEVSRVNWVESVGVSVAFIVVILGLACWRFARKDF